MFKIQDHLEFDDKGRAVCPCCASKGKTRDRTLSIVPGTGGAYKCHRNCRTDDIRAALGVAKPQMLSQAQIKSPPSKSVSVPPQKVKEAHQRLIESDGPAKQWLNERGITDEMIARYQLGITRSKIGDRHLPSITIPLPNADGTAYYQKKRVMPWLPESEQPPEYKKWSQYGIPSMVWFTWLPAEAKETWLCEGEWDAILLGWMLRKADSPIAVASFTCGASTVPPTEQLQKLPGQVTIFYDGDEAGDKGSRKVALALGDGARIAQVPRADDCQISGWDVSDAINAGFTLAQFAAAAANAVKPALEPRKENPLRARLVSNDELIARAPDYVEWLVPDLLTTNELFALAAPPRGGKSLMAMALARCVATGEKFLDRPVMKGPVIYVNLEDSEAKIKEREESQQWGEGVPVYWLDKFKLTEMEHLIELIQEIRPKLVILDTLSRIRSDAVSEGSAEMGLVLEPLQEAAKQFNVCILLIHHTKKIDADNANTIDIFDTMRGSGAIRATCQGVLIIAPAENSYRLVAENGHGKHDLKSGLTASVWSGNCWAGGTR
ncbi:MAG: AAA family ATPase [Leptolyngbyaceae cyanobacterium SM1_4_3]|nr:AAA family ATPase [Leptolyngbyaceae cyanobacterium SM1_4_3]NJO66960.1 AAA family ATPase [Leptolyngbyaceae cyanobacterium RM1_405_57]